MHTPGANTNFLPVMRIAAPIPAMRITSHNARAGNQA
jgi:hypothetical protein